VNILDGYSAPTILAAALIAILGTARLTRLFSEDSYPPVLWLRQKWIGRFNHSGWSELAICPFCQAPYLSIITIAWGWATDLHWTWWFFYGWLSLSYLAAIVVARDIPQE
jgi:hypothetical protein